MREHVLAKEEGIGMRDYYCLAAHRRIAAATAASAESTAAEAESAAVAAGLLGRNMVLLRDLGVSIRGNACRLLHGLSIASADGRALCSCCTGYWRILRAA